MFKKCFYQLSTKFLRSFNTKMIKKPIKKPLHKNILEETLTEMEINQSDRKNWKNLRNRLLQEGGMFNEKSIDSIFLNYCVVNKKYDHAKKYVEYLQSERIKLNLGALGKYLRMFYSMYYDGLMEEKDEKGVFKVYEDLLKEYEVLDSITLEQLICGLSVTNSWRKCIDLLSQSKLTSVPSTNSYNSLISSAFRNNESQLGWELFNEMIENNRSPLNITYKSILNELKTNQITNRITNRITNPSNPIQKLDKFLDVLDYYDLQFDKEIANYFMEILKELKIKANFTKISHRGFCPNCKINLEESNLTNDEFKTLKGAFLKEVVIGKDVFCKTTPEELVRFKSFIKNMGNFDVVIDGLNTQYSQGIQSPQFISTLLSDVVSYFTRQNKKVLLLGRKHMEKLPGKNWNFIKRNSEVFLTQDVSQDDPFILYCALHCGNDTKIVTRDLMRSHLFLLKDKQLKKLFKRWLMQNRLHLVTAKKGNVIFKEPLKYMISSQKNGNIWHVPYVREVKENPKVVIYEWICIET